MRYFTAFLCLALFLGACKQEPRENNESATMEPGEEAHPLDRLAAAHGFEHWKDVSEIRFTFNVDRDTMHYERSWIWNPRENRVTRIAQGDTVSFLRSEVDSTLADADGGFINDKYWMLAPYQWVWDRDSFTWEIQDSVPAPISGTPMQKLTIVYGDEGGYTPGDAYDFYIGNDSLVAEWVFRRGNQPEPNLASTWEDYRTYDGLRIATMHRNETGPSIYFTGIEVN